MFTGRFFQSSPFQELIADCQDGYNTDNVIMADFPQGGARSGSNYGDRIPYLRGEWVQWELHYRPNTTAGGIADNNGFLRRYRNGVLVKTWENANLNGTQNMRTGVGVEVGGVYTAINWAQDPYGLTGPVNDNCANWPGYYVAWPYPNAEGARVTDLASPLCANQFPPDGHGHYFYRYLDDIIVMKKTSDAVTPSFSGISISGGVRIQ